jgi:hypothetical protein
MLKTKEFLREDNEMIVYPPPGATAFKGIGTIMCGGKQ